MFQDICNTGFLTNRIKQICGPKNDLLATAVHFGVCSSDKLASRFFLFLPSVGIISPVILSTRPINLHLARDLSFSLSQWDICRLVRRHLLALYISMNDTVHNL